MAGYSGTPLAKKLGIQNGASAALLNAPSDFESQLEGLPADASLARDPRGGRHDVIVLFTASKAELSRRFAGAAKRLVPDGGLWIAWPKKASGVTTDLDENNVREIGLAAGLVDNKVCAIDETWSGLRFVIRLKDRPPKHRPSRPGRR